MHRTLVTIIALFVLHIVVGFWALTSALLCGNYPVLMIINLCLATVNFTTAWFSYRQIAELANEIDSDNKTKRIILELIINHHGKNESKDKEQTEREAADKNESEDESAH